MRYDPEDTIAAIASAPGGAARGIVRLGGADAIGTLAVLLDTADPRPLRAATTPGVFSAGLALGQPFAPLPADVYLWPGHRSYTGQPLVELHTLGSPPLLQAVLDRLLAAGARLAGPGEFTLRAFLAGRLDLTQAEAVLGVIDAGNRRQLDTALEQLAGGLAVPLGQLRADLLELLAHLEAGFDFADEDLPFLSAEQLLSQLRESGLVVGNLRRQIDSRSIVESGADAVLIGYTNVGKSSLFNRLAERAAAIVSDRPGTTRDYLVAELELAGAWCRLIDTAGFDADRPGNENAAIHRASQQARDRRADAASLRILCLDATRPLNDRERRELETTGAGAPLVVWTKTDRAAPPLSIAGAVPTSAVSGQGIDTLRNEIARRLAATDLPQGAVIAETAARCRLAIAEAEAALSRAWELARDAAGEELVAAELRGALEHLGEVVGAVYTDDILDRIFSRFCVGK
jgi:tRNA modification GTPase